MSSTRLCGKEWETNFRKWLKEDHPNIRILSFESPAKATFKCKCGREWGTAPKSVFSRKSGCKVCSAKARRGTSPQSVAARKKYVATCKRLKLEILEPLGTYGDKHKHRCLKCDNEFDVRPADVITARAPNNRCPECAKIRTSERRKKAHPDSYFFRKIKEHGKLKPLEIVRDPNGRENCRSVCLTCGLEVISDKRDQAQGTGCPQCAVKNKRFKFRQKHYRLGKRDILVMGFEPFALDFIQSKGIKPKDIRTDNDQETPVLTMHNGHKYYPDIWIPSKNILAEVKSTFTLGLEDRNTYINVRLKAKTALEQGYDFRLLVFTRQGRRLKMPRDWTTLTYKQFEAEFKRINGIRH